MGRYAREDTDAVPVDERDALVTIADGAVVTSAGFSGRRLLITMTEFVLARGLGPVAYGVYALAWRIAQLLAGLVTFGSLPTLQRYLPAYRDAPDRRAAVVGLAYGSTLVFGAFIATVLWIAAPWINAHSVDHPAFPATLRAFGILVVLLGVVTITGGIFRALESARGEVLLNKLLRPGVRLVGAFVALSLGYAVVGVAAGMVVATGLLVVLAVPLVIRRTGISPSIRAAGSEAGPFYNHAAPVVLSRFGKVFQNRIDVLLVGALLSAVAAGVYNVILVLVAVAWIPLLSFNQLLPPIAAELYTSDRMDSLNRIYATVTRLILTAVMPILCLLVVYGQGLLTLFGPTYSRGYVPLVIYLGGVLVGSAVGATGWLLMMTDHQYVRMALDWLLAVLNFALTFFFIHQFGLAGAALGTSLAIAVQNVIQVVVLRKFEGLWPFGRRFLAPVLAGICMLAILSIVRVSLPGYLGMVGPPAGLVGYAAALHGIGIAPRDRLVIRELLHQYRASLASLGAK